MAVELLRGPLSPEPEGVFLEQPEEGPPRPIEPGIDVEKAKEELLSHFDYSYNYLQAFYPRWLRYYKLYRCYSDPKTRPWRANVFVPIPFTHVEHGLGVMMEAWAAKPAIRVFPREGTDYRGAKTVEAYLEWEDDDMSVFLTRYEIIKEMLLYGTAWAKVYWDWVERRNVVDSVSVWNLFPDPTAESLDDAEWVIHRSLRSAGYLKRLARAGVYDISESEIDRMAQGGFTKTLQGERLLGEVLGDARTTFQNRVEVLEESYPDRVVTVLNREKVVRAHPSRFPHGKIPFVRWVDHAVPHELFGVGEIEVIEKLVEELNDIRNQRLDVVSQAINNVLVASKMAGIDPDDLVMRPGQVIWANNVDAVRPLIQHTGGISIGVQEESLVRFDVQEATGNWGYNMGQVPARREAATTVLALQRAAGMRFTSKVRWNEESAVKREAAMRIANAQAFLPPQRWIRITGSPLPVQLDRESIRGVYDYVPAASTAEPKEAKRAQIGQILPLLLKSPRLNEAKFLDWLLDLYNVKERQEFLLSDEEMAHKIRLMQMAKMAGMNGEGGGVGRGRMPTMIGSPARPPGRPVPEEIEDIAAGGEEEDLVRAALEGV